MYMFGGYVEGTKANDLWKYIVATKEWQIIDEGDKG